MVLEKLKNKIPYFLRAILTIFIVGLVFYPLLAIITEAIKVFSLSASIKAQLASQYLSSLSFSISISFLSTFIAIILGACNFFLLKGSFEPVRQLLLGILFIPSSLTSIVSTLSLLVFFGKQGLLNNCLDWIGLEKIWNHQNLYSYGMLAFLNILYNFPISTLIFWGVDKYFPLPLLQKAKILGANTIQVFFSTILPLCIPHLLSSFALIFVCCFLSFFPVLFLGNTLDLKTPEVIIYEQVAWNFSLSSASWIAFWQIILLWILLSIFSSQKPQYMAFHKSSLEFETYKRDWKSTLGSLILSGITSLLWLPLLIKTFSLPLMRLIQSFLTSLNSFNNSLLIGVLSGFFTVTLSAWLLFNYPNFLSTRKSYLLIFLPFTFSPLLTSLVYQNLLSSWFKNPSPIAGLVITQVILNFPLTLYFLSRDLGNFQSLSLRAKTLGVKGFSRWLTLDFPLFRLSYLRIFFLSLMSSLGNLSTGLLYLSSDFETIPLHINRLLGSYRIEEASITASLFILLFLFFLGIYLWINRFFRNLN